MEQELIKRYRYLFLNSEIILASMLVTDKNKGVLVIENTHYEEDLLNMLLEDIPLEETQFYNFLETMKKKDSFKHLVYLGIDKIKETHDGPGSNFWIILTTLRNYLIMHNPSSIKRRQELETMDEYYRLNRTTSTKRIYISGYHIELEDIPNCNFRYLNKQCRLKKEYHINNSDKTVRGSNFVNFFASVDYSGKEKYAHHIKNDENRKIYLSLHDTIDDNIIISCDYSIDSDDLPRVFSTKPCHNEFYLNEEEIFTDLKGNFYQMCPRCGYIVKIDSELLVEPVQERIIKKAHQDENYLKKINILSELTFLEYKSNSPTRILKNNLVR